jgi:hypothetical protein
MWIWKRFRVIRPRKIDGKFLWLTYAYRYPSPIIWPWMAYKYKTERQFVIDELRGRNE